MQFPEGTGALAYHIFYILCKPQLWCPLTLIQAQYFRQIFSYRLKHQYKYVKLLCNYSGWNWSWVSLLRILDFFLRLITFVMHSNKGFFLKSKLRNFVSDKNSFLTTSLNSTNCTVLSARFLKFEL